MPFDELRGRNYLGEQNMRSNLRGHVDQTSFHINENRLSIRRFNARQAQEM